MHISRIKRSSRFKESQFTMNFGSAAGEQRIFNQKHPFVSHPLNDIEDTKVTNKFMKWLSLDLLKFHVKRNTNQEHYKKGKSRKLFINFGVLSVKNKNWFYIMGTLGQSWSDEQIDVCFYYLRKQSKYDHNSLYMYNTVDYNFLNIINSVLSVYRIDDASLNVGAKKYHLNEYINELLMHATVPWHTADHIFILVNVKVKPHWVLMVISFNDRCIYVYDSLSSTCHDDGVLSEVEKLAEVIPICFIVCKFYEKEGVDLANHPNYKSYDKIYLFDVYIIEDLPQRPSVSL
ncbi:hypothetical protein FXO38_00152 [Capsicum annuum]|nr:hypothetical protein FXO38_00152 [Capsicum annuum]